MLEVIKKLVIMINEEIDVLVNNIKTKDEYINRVKSAGDDIEILKQIAKAENGKLECESQLVELYDYKQSLIELQCNCDNQPKDNETFSGLLAKFGPPPKKYDMFRELFNGENWGERLNKHPNNTEMWDMLEFVMDRGGNNE